jgi:hypothetical protein
MIPNNLKERLYREVFELVVETQVFLMTNYPPRTDYKKISKAQ